MKIGPEPGPHGQLLVRGEMCIRDRQNVTPKDAPEWIRINCIAASPFDPGTAYVAATMYLTDDFHPFLWKTTDYGKTWKKIVDGIPDVYKRQK